MRYTKNSAIFFGPPCMLQTECSMPLALIEAGNEFQKFYGTCIVLSTLLDK